MNQKGSSSKVSKEVPFSDGNVTGAVRVEDTVKRSTGPWTPAVHGLLRHLEATGFQGAPRLLGVDERGREVLSYIEGETSPDPRVSFASDEALAEVARLLRSYHDATTGFVPPPDARWRFEVGAPTEGDVICHNDVAPYNTIVREGRPVAFIDWDFAAPAPRVWDIAHALWRFVPFYDDETFGTPSDQARRMRVFCDAYGLLERQGLMDVIARRMWALHESIRCWAEAGDPVFVSMWREGHASGIPGNVAYLQRHRAEFERER